MSIPIPRRPTALYRMHRVLISTGAVASLVMTLWGVRQYRRFGESSSLAVSAFGVVAAIALMTYLRYFNAKVSKQDALRDGAQPK